MSSANHFRIYVELQSEQENESSMGVACFGPSSDGGALTC